MPEKEYGEPRPYCKEQFEKIESRLNKGDDHFGVLDRVTSRLGANVEALTKSLDDLSKALWGACGTALVICAGFIVWYIQNH